LVIRLKINPQKFLLMADSMRIAILGAKSQIAKDLIISFSQHTDYHCMLFSRSPKKVATWLQSIDKECLYQPKGYLGFSGGDYDAIINFVGVGDPACAKAMGASIFDTTYQYDQLALDYLKAHPECRYIFLSSGAVYGDVFSKPVDKSSVAEVPINHLDSTNWYMIAKQYAEARHRALSEYGIIDIRVFNYFSHTQDIDARFLITDIVRAIRDGSSLKTSPENIVRDFLHPSDFYQLICCLLKSPRENAVVDCYSNKPVDKMTLLAVMQEEFDLSYEISSETSVTVNATGCKAHYYSLNRRAEYFGYKPDYSSIECILNEANIMIDSFLVNRIGES